MPSFVPDFLVRSVLWLADRVGWLHDLLNSIAINRAVNVCRHRPHPWSTVHDYVSWASLSDQRWSARHLPATRIANLPSPLDVIGIFKRPAGPQQSCRKSTCLFPAFAQYLTDGFIRTRMPNTRVGETDDVRRQNTSNHQIDMCPLYGRVKAQTDALREMSGVPGRRGRLKSQMIGDEEFPPYLFQGGETVKPEFELLDPPLGLDNFPDPGLRAHIFAAGGDRTNGSPQVAMVNVLFLREHNRLAGVIEASNPGWDDERVFQTARNCVIVMFIKIVVEEYINHISPLFRFRADPSVAWNAGWNKPNWITTEFSLLYRWHSLIPDTIRWNGASYPLGDTLMNNRLLVDAGLVGAFADMSAQPAGRLGAFNTSAALLHVEASAIAQGRICEVASYADYREYVSLSRPRQFSDISKNPQVVEFLSRTYKGVDDVEFYVGLFAEDTEKNSPLPELILKLVAVDAFSQALTNPLLSEHVFIPETFSAPGWEAINRTGSLRDMLDRNSIKGVGAARISMMQAGWKPE